MKKTLTNILRNSLLAGSLSLVCIASDGCYNRSVDNYKPASSTASKEYSAEDREYVPTLEDFKRVLGDRYIPEREGELRELFASKDELDISDRKMFYEIYAFPESVKETMPKDMREDYANFIISDEKIDEYQEKFYWNFKPTNSQLTESDKLMLFFLNSMDESKWYGSIKLF